MTVILEAFGGFLKSGPLEWPDDAALDIRLRLDNPIAPRTYNKKSVEIVSSRACRFQFTGLYEPVPGRLQAAKVYRLVDL